jgi:hypothetical protein
MNVTKFKLIDDDPASCPRCEKADTPDTDRKIAQLEQMLSIQRQIRETEAKLASLQLDFDCAVRGEL